MDKSKLKLSTWYKEYGGLQYYFMHGKWKGNAIQCINISIYPARLYLLLQKKDIEFNFEEGYAYDLSTGRAIRIDSLREKNNFSRTIIRDAFKHKWNIESSK